MEALVNALRTYILRDAGYVLGGSLVLASTLWVVGSLQGILSLGGPTQLLLLGYSYVIGFAVQQIFTLTPCSTLADFFVPGPITRWLYERSRRHSWRFDEAFDAAEIDAMIYERATAANREWLERMASQRILVAAAGSGSVTAAAALGIGYLRSCDRLMIYAAAGLFLAGVILLLLSWLLASLQLEYTYVLRRQLLLPGRRDVS